MGQSRFLTLLILLSFSSTVGAWGANGHRVIGELAQQQLSVTAHAAVSELLQGESLAFASTWADEMRSSKDNLQFWGSRYTGSWHYVNIAAGETYNSALKNPNGDAVMALETYIAILRDEPIPAGPVREGLEFYYGDLNAKRTELKRFALKFLLHIVGDLQQPLHSGYAEDQGGNQVDINWFGQNSNLHTLWDTHLVEHSQLSYTELTAKLATRISLLSSAEVQTLARATPAQWISEALVLRDQVYKANVAGTDFSYDYAFEFVPVVEDRLLRGGLRLGWLLNEIFAK